MVKRFEKISCNIFNCRYWCSTKVDNDLEHIAGQGNWGFCRQSCPPITLVTTTLRPTTTTASKISEAASIGDYTSVSVINIYHNNNILFLKTICRSSGTCDENIITSSSINM